MDLRQALTASEFVKDVLTILQMVYVRDELVPSHQAEQEQVKKFNETAVQRARALHMT